MRDAFIAELLALAHVDPRIMLVTGDLGFKVLDDFFEQLPAQILNVGVAEQNMAGIATGLALSGKVVFTYSIANFPTLRCLEQLRNGACYHQASVNVVSVGGGFSYGQLGFSHHGTEDLAILRALPGTTVVAPGDIWETAGATRALAQRRGVGYLRLDKMAAPPSHLEGDAFQLGKIRMIRTGSAATIFAIGGVLGEALSAAEQLVEQGIAVSVGSVHTLKPLDTQAVIDAARRGPVVTVEEHAVCGGLAGAVAECFALHGVLPSRFVPLGLNDKFATVVGEQAFLRAEYGLDAGAIVGAVRQALKTRTVDDLKV